MAADLRFSKEVSKLLFEKYKYQTIVFGKIKQLLKCDNDYAHDVMEGKADLTISEVSRLLGNEEFIRIVKQLNEEKWNSQNTK